MSGKLFANQLGNWCRHYSGLMNDTCKAGIRYDDVKDKRDRGVACGLARFPCFKDSNCAECCTTASFLSEEEIRAEEERSNQAIAAFLKELNEGKTCPHCHRTIEKRYQVGRCVYAKPCGCRQYQGVVSKAERTAKDQQQIDEASLWCEME